MIIITYIAIEFLSKQEVFINSKILLNIKLFILIFITINSFLEYILFNDIIIYGP